MHSESPLSFRPATEADVGALMELRKATMMAHLQRAGAPSDEQSLLARVTYRLEDAQLVFMGTEMVGLLKVSRTGQEWKLVQIQVTPARQGQGLGEQLIRRVLADADRQGCSVVLDVLRGNPAKRLYERLGFVAVSEDERSYVMRYAARHAQGRAPAA